MWAHRRRSFAPGWGARSASECAPRGHRNAGKAQRNEGWNLMNTENDNGIRIDLWQRVGGFKKRRHVMKMKRVMFSTCCLALFSISVMAQTTNSTTELQKADPAAWNMLKSARETSQTLPTNFAGVTFDVVLNDNGKVAKGSINYEAGKSAEIKVEG